MRQTKVDHVLNGLADLVVKHERTITTQAKIIEVLREGLEHYLTAGIDRYTQPPSTHSERYRRQTNERQGSG
jgi:hypothetical protein